MTAVLALLFAATPLRVTTQLEHTYLSERAGGEVVLQIDLAADPAREAAHRVPVNAVMILDRSGSMTGFKIECAREAARALIRALGPQDRFSVVEFSDQARVLVQSTAATPGAKETALALVSALRAGGGTNMSAAFDAAAPQLSEGRAPGRMDKVFVASDGQANLGVAARPALLRLAISDFGAATVSTFGIGQDYDELFMTQLAVQAGGRARYVASGTELAPAFAAELSRAANAVAHDVRLEVRPVRNVRVERVLGFEASADGIRLPDIAAGEARRVMVKLSVPPGRGTAELADIRLTWRDARGAEQNVRRSAQAQYTADAATLDAQKPNSITWQAAMSEMADAAATAVRYQAQNQPELAKKEQERVQEVAARAAAAAPPGAAAKLKASAGLYSQKLDASAAGEQAARNALSADAAGESTAPVSF